MIIKPWKIQQFKSIIPPIASLLLALMALSHFLRVPFPELPAWLGGLAAWLALFLLFFLLPRLTFNQFWSLTLAGLVCLFWGLQYTKTAFPWQDLLAQNTSLLTLLYSVGFLKLVALPEQQKQPLPVGIAAYFKTLVGVHVLGAIINLSILVLVTSRYQAKDFLNKASVTTIGHAFSSAAFWSPFFAAMGVVLTYAPGAPLLSVMSLGLLLTVFALSVSTLLTGGWKLNKLKVFSGYPIQADSLLVPVLLAASVLLLHELWPAIKMLTLVSILAIAVTLGVVVWRSKQGAWLALQQHVSDAAPRMARELSLFLGAGVLAVGLQTLLVSKGNLHLFTQFGSLEATFFLAAALIVSMIGVHPLVSIAVTSQLVMPLQADLTLLAVLFLSMWSLGVVASPFSGVNVMLRGQFDLSGRDLFKWNLPYVVIMWCVVSLVFVGYEHY